MKNGESLLKAYFYGHNENNPFAYSYLGYVKYDEEFRNQVLEVFDSILLKENLDSGFIAYVEAEKEHVTELMIEF